MLNNPHIDLIEFAERLFPADAFAEAPELQACVRSGRVRDGAGLTAFLRRQLESGIRRHEVGIIGQATQHTEEQDLPGVLALDTDLDARDWMRERGAESRWLGRQALQLATSLLDSSLLRSLAERVEAGATPGHHAVVFGLAAAQLGWSARVAAQAYLQATARAAVQAAVSAAAVNEEDGEAVLWSLDEVVARVAREAAGDQVRRTTSSVRSSPSTSGSANASTHSMSREAVASALS
jgi:urease accessory protein